MHALGFVMVAQVNCQREDPLQSGNPGHGAFWGTLGLATLFYFTSGIATLRTRNHLSGYCPENDSSYVSNTGIDTELDQTRCYIYSDWEVFSYNYFIWGFSFFFIGL